jgi:hypothetical protein
MKKSQEISFNCLLNLARPIIKVSEYADALMMGLPLKSHFLMLSLIALLAAPTGVSANESSGALRVRVTKCIQDSIVNNLTADFSGKSISVQLSGAENTVSIQLYEKLGSGLGARVYPVNSSYFDRYEKASSGVVVKLAHSPSWRSKPKAWAYLNGVIDSEYSQFLTLRDSLLEIQKDFELPKNFGWEKNPGNLPFAEIFEIGTLENGDRVLFKQKIVGSKPEEIQKEYGDNLPDNLIKGLKKIYDLNRVLYRTVKADGKPFMLDIYPSNFIWVEKPADLEKMGLRDPSFVMVEASSHPKPVFVENYSFDQFLSDYKTYIKLSSPH